MPEEENKDSSLETKVSESENNSLENNEANNISTENEKEDPEVNMPVESHQPIDLDKAPIQQNHHKEYKPSKIERLKKQTNLYLLIFGLIIVVALIIVRSEEHTSELQSLRHLV